MILIPPLPLPPPLLLSVSGTAEPAASSPEASRDDGCKRSVVDDAGIAVVGSVDLRFRLAVPDPVDDGEDITAGVIGLIANWLLPERQQQSTL